MTDDLKILLDAKIAELGLMPRTEAIRLLEEALFRLREPKQNGNGGPIQMGGIYWRLARVLENFADWRLSAFEGADHASFIRETHGRLRRWMPLSNFLPPKNQWLLLRHQCPCCDSPAVSIARFTETNEWIYKHPTDDSQEIKVEGWKDAWQEYSFGGGLTRAKLQ